MAETAFGTNDALCVKRWAKEFATEYRVESFFENSGFIGRSANSIVQELTDLMKEPGDKITFPLVMAIDQAPIMDDDTVLGKEAALVHYSCSVTIHKRTFAVAIEGEMTERRVAMNLRQQAKDRLMVRMTEDLDEEIFDALSTSPSTNRVKYGGDATSTATIEATDYLTLDLISKVKAFARATADPKLRPLRIGGKDRYVMIIHDHCMYDLRVNDAKFNQVWRELGPRGQYEDNPLIRNCEFMWDDVLVFTHPSVPVATNWGSGSNVYGATNLFLGAQAAVLAYGGRKYKAGGRGHIVWAEHEKPYGVGIGFAISDIRGVAKTVFNSEDFGVIAVRTARSQIT